MLLVRSSSSWRRCSLLCSLKLRKRARLWNHQFAALSSLFETRGSGFTQTAANYNTDVNRCLVESGYLELNHELVDTSKPLVALESTIITHGMPYPKNIEMALDVESVIREHGAVPVTIGLVNGKLKAGLTRAEIEHLAKNTQRSIKISRRDLPFVLSNRHDRPLFGGNFRILFGFRG